MPGTLTIVARAIDSSYFPSFVTPRAIVESGPNRYVFYRDGNADLAYAKSADRGVTWAETVVHAGSYEHIGVWFDRWTPGDSGTVIHIWGMEGGANNVNYFSLDVATGSLGNGGTPIVVYDGASLSTFSNTVELSGAKSRGGNLYVAFDGDGGTEHGLYRSVDAGANWTARTSPVEGAFTSDKFLLYPGNEADNQDMWLVFWDSSASEISLKTYDDSANSYAEQSISGSMTDVATSTVRQQFSGTIRLSDSHLFLVAWNSRDVSTSDLKCWDINGSGSITAKTDVVTNADDCDAAGLALDHREHLHCTYLGKADGSETAQTALTVNRKSSADGGTTWSAEYPVFDDFAADIQILFSGLQSEGSYPFSAWYVNNFNISDVIAGAYRPGSARAQSMIGG